MSKRKELPFIIFSSFLLSFLVARISVLMMSRDVIRDFALHVRGVHVHHFNIGIVLITIIGFITLSYRTVTDRYIHRLAVLYGIGLGLAYDEFSLWIQLDANDYWTRYSYDAILVISLLFLNIVYFKNFWKYILRTVSSKNPVKML